MKGMMSHESSSLRVPAKCSLAKETPTTAAGRSYPAKTKRSLLPWVWTRQSLVVATTALTVAVFSLDMLLNDWSVPLSLSEWVLGDGGLLFYVIGFGCAYAFICFGRSSRSLAKSGKSTTATAGKSICTERESTAAVVSKPVVQAPVRKAAYPNAKPFIREGNLKPAPCGGADASVAFADVESRLDKPTTPSNNSAVKVNYAISQAAARGDAEAAGAVLERMEAEGLDSDATSYNLIIRACAKNNDRHAAEHWFHKMQKRGLEPNEYSYNTLMNAYAKSEDVKSVEAWMQRMQSSGVTATGISYAIVIHASARRGDVDSASNWLGKMIAAGLTPDCVNYNSLIHACSIRKDAEGAEHWFEKLTARGLEPTVMTYTAMVDACSKSLDVKKAEKWMDRMLDLGLMAPNVVSFSAMVDACARVGDIERAERWYGKMREHEVQPNAYIYSALINACAKACDVAAAIEWLKRAEESGTTLDAVVYGCVINACGKIGDSAGAMTAFRQMRSHGIQTHIVVYAALARPFAYSGDWEQVEKIQEEMAADGIRMNDYFLYTVLLSYSRAKPRRGDRAEIAFHKALSEGVQPNDRVIKALSSAVGRVRCAQILDALGIENPETRDHDAGSTPHHNARRV